MMQGGVSPLFNRLSNFSPYDDNRYIKRASTMLHSKIVDFEVPFDHRLKLKESERENTKTLLEY